MELTDIQQRFVIHWGEMGSAWGVNRTVAQIHALLFIHGRPLHAEELAATLGVARSNVSNSLKELQNWGLVRVTHTLGDRRDYFETSGDVWELFRTIVRGRKEREFDPTTRLLAELAAREDFAQEPPEAQDRVRETLRLMQALGGGDAAPVAPHAGESAAPGRERATLRARQAGLRQDWAPARRVQRFAMAPGADGGRMAFSSSFLHSMMSW